MAQRPLKRRLELLSIGFCHAPSGELVPAPDDDIFLLFALLASSHFYSLPCQMPTGLKHPPPRRSAATIVHDGVIGNVDCFEEEAETGGSRGGKNSNENRSNNQQT